MEHPSPNPTMTRLRELLHKAGIALTEAEATLIFGHTLWVLEQTKSINLTAINSLDDALRLHVVDSLLALPEIEKAPTGALLDLGSGGGYPGVPLGIASHRETLLLDSVQKKVRVLQGYLEEAGLSPTIRAQPGRAEEFARDNIGSYAVVTARAVAALPSLVELARPFTGTGALFVAMKGGLEDEELRRGDAVAAIVGFKRATLRRYVLPEGGEARTIVTYTAKSDSKLSLPRRMGLAQKKPLA